MGPERKLALELKESTVINILKAQDFQKVPENLRVAESVTHVVIAVISLAVEVKIILLLPEDGLKEVVLRAVIPLRIKINLKVRKNILEEAVLKAVIPLQIKINVKVQDVLDAKVLLSREILPQLQSNGRPMTDEQCIIRGLEVLGILTHVILETTRRLLLLYILCMAASPQGIVQ